MSGLPLSVCTTAPPLRRYRGPQVLWGSGVALRCYLHPQAAGEPSHNAQGTPSQPRLVHPKRQQGPVRKCCSQSWRPQRETRSGGHLARVLWARVVVAKIKDRGSPSDSNTKALGRQEHSGRTLSWRGTRLFT